MSWATSAEQVKETETERAHICSKRESQVIEKANYFIIEYAMSKENLFNTNEFE